jgi:hypothetical protein
MVLCLGLLFTSLALPTQGVVIPGDEADGRIMTNTVFTGGTEIGVGHYGDTTATFGATAIFFFKLPAPEDLGAVRNAVFSFSLNDKSGSFVTDPASADVWGIGYVNDPVIDPDWYLAGDDDLRTGVNIGANKVMKLADDLMSPSTLDPASPANRVVLPDPTLAEFIALLYDQGASAGSYAVIRMNIDVPTSSVNRRFDVATADDPIVAARPELAINENTVLLYDPFEDGDRTNGDDPLDTDWYRVTDTSDQNFLLAVTNDSAGTGSGNALNVEMGEIDSRFVGGFPEVTLADPGDFLQLTVTFRPTFVVLGNTEKFRLAILTSGGNPIGADTGSSSSAAHYSGYMLRMSTGGSNPDDLSVTQSNQHFPQSFLGGSGTNLDFMVRNANAVVVDESDIYSLTYTLTRSSATQIAARVVLNDAVLDGSDPGTDSDAHDWKFNDTFDAIGWGCNGGDGVWFIADDIRVESNVGLVDVVAHEDVVVEAIESVFDTQPGVAYGLEEAADLVGGEWTPTGYRVKGDGAPMRVYDPEATQPNTTYRLVD